MLEKEIIATQNIWYQCLAIHIFTIDPLVGEKRIKTRHFMPFSLWAPDLGNFLTLHAKQSVQCTYSQSPSPCVKRKTELNKRTFLEALRRDDVSWPSLLIATHKFNFAKTKYYVLHVIVSDKMNVWNIMYFHCLLLLLQKLMLCYEFSCICQTLRWKSTLYSPLDRGWTPTCLWHQ